MDIHELFDGMSIASSTRYPRQRGRATDQTFEYMSNRYLALLVIYSRKTIESCGTYTELSTTA